MQFIEEEKNMKMQISVKNKNLPIDEKLFKLSSLIFSIFLTKNITIK